MEKLKFLTLFIFTFILFGCGNKEKTKTVFDGVNISFDYKDVSSNESYGYLNVSIEGDDGYKGNYQRKGTNVTLTIEESNDNCTFVGLYLDNVLVSSTRTYSFVADKDYRFVIKIANKWNMLSIDTWEEYAGEVEYVKPSSDREVGYNEEVIIKAKPFPGYIFKGWYDINTDELVSNDETYTFNMPSGKVVLNAKFDIDPLMNNFEFSSIGGECFINNVKDSTKDIVIPSFVTGLSSRAFSNCNGNIYYNGTLEDWCNLNIGGVDANPMTFASSLYFLDANGDTEIQGNKYSLITELVIPNNVKIINNYTFNNFKQLTSIVIPNSVEEIRCGAFYGCTSLTTINLPFIGDKRHNVDDYHQYPLGWIFGTIRYTDSVEITQEFKNTYMTASTKYYFPASLKKAIVSGECYIPCGAFSYTKLTDIEIGEGITSIESIAFYYCSYLVNLTIPNSLKNIGKDALDQCTKLEYYSYGNGYYLGNDDNYYVVLVKAKDKDIQECIVNEKCSIIYSYAFYGTKLKNVELSSVKSVLYRAFDCSTLEKVYFDGTIEDWCNINYIDTTSPMNYATSFYMIDVNGTVVYNGNTYKLIEEIELPNTLTEIKDYTFEGFNSITSIIIPNSVKRIGNNAFCRCTNLTNVVIPDGVLSIGSYAFSSCSSLEKIVLPNSLQSVEEDSFDKYGSLLFYYGTSSEWYSFTDNTFQNLYFYSEEQPIKTGNYWHYVTGVPIAWEN